jgi:hypothetical protein
LAVLYANKGFITYFGTGDIYCLFFEKGNCLLKNGGILSYINPNTWLQSITFGDFRKYLSSNFAWNRILITDKVFEATVDTHCVVFNKSNIQTDCVVFRKDKTNICFLHTISKDCISKVTGCINIESDSGISNLANRILNQNRSFADLYRIYNGVKPFEKGKGTPPQTEKTMKEKPYVKEGPKPGKDWKPLMRGSLMTKYVSFWDDNYWILYGEWLAAPRRHEIFDAKEKIIIRQTGDSLVATIIGSGIICRDNLHICIPNSNADSKYILGLINSKLMNFIYSFINPETGEALAQVKKKHVELLPMKTCLLSQQQPIIALVDKILAAKKADPRADTGAWEAEIDFLVYKLYGLSYDEVLVVDPETGITKEEYERG